MQVTNDTFSLAMCESSLKPRGYTVSMASDNRELLSPSVNDNHSTEDHCGGEGSMTKCGFQYRNRAIPW